MLSVGINEPPHSARRAYRQTLPAVKTGQPRVCVETECKDNTKIPESPPVRANFDGWPAESAPARACGRSLLLQPRGGRAAPRPKVSVQPADGRRGRGRGFVRPQRRAAGIIGRRSAEQIRADRFVPEPTAGHAGYFPRRKGRRVMAPPRRPVRHSNGLSEAGRGGRAKQAPFGASGAPSGRAKRGRRKTFCGSAPAAENACGIRRNVRGEAACGTRPAERKRAPGRNRGRAGSGAGNNSAGICAFYRRNFVSLSGS